MFIHRPSSKELVNQYSEKHSTSPLVFHGRGACSIRQKIIILAGEGSIQTQFEEKFNVLSNNEVICLVNMEVHGSGFYFFFLFHFKSLYLVPNDDTSLSNVKYENFSGN